MLQDIEDQFAQPLRGRADGARGRRGESAAFEAPADDPHGSGLSGRPARPAAWALSRSLARRSAGRAARGAAVRARRPALAALAAPLALWPVELAIARRPVAGARAGWSVPPGSCIGPVKAALTLSVIAAARAARLEIGAGRFLSAGAGRPRSAALKAPCWPPAFRAIEAAPAWRAVAGTGARGMFFGARPARFEFRSRAFALLAVARPPRVEGAGPARPFACFAAGASRARPAPLARFGGGPFGELGRGRRQALDGDGPPLAVLGRAAFDPFARPRGGGRLCDDFRPQRRDMLAATLGRRGRGRDLAGRRIVARDRLLLSLVAASAPRLRKAHAARAFPPSLLLAAPVVRARLFPGLLRRRAPLDERERRNRRRLPWRASRPTGRAAPGCALPPPRPQRDRRVRTGRTRRG